MTKIFAFAGKKQSGKNSLGNFVLGTTLWCAGIVNHTYKIMDDGHLWISDLFNDTERHGIFDTNYQHPDFQLFLEKEVNSTIKMYSFADILKRDVCMNILGLTYEQCYGTDAEKDSLTNIKWDDLPGRCCITIKGENPPDIEDILGFMTGREVLQYVGTDIFRSMYKNVWVDALFRKIKKDNPKYAVITDARFHNEFDKVLDNNGTLIKLTRDVCESDGHSSENQLETYKGSFSYVIDNKDMNINEQNTEMHKILKQEGLYKEFNVHKINIPVVVH